jgi:membrane protease YdiL (CAAX protease family)
MSSTFLAEGYGWGTVVLMICVEPAVFEEMAFRGVIFSALRIILSPMETVFVTALLFMALHLSPGNFPHTLALGLTAGFLRLRTGSLLPGMLLHFAHNFMCVLQEAWWPAG